MLQAKITALLKTARPAFLLLTPCCLSVAVAFAIYEGIEIDLVNLALIFTGALAAHVSVNMLNEYHDYKTGLDLQTQRTAFSGGSGTLPASPELAESVLFCGLLCLVFTALIGLYFLWTIGWVYCRLVYRAWHWFISTVPKLLDGHYFVCLLLA